MFKDGAFIWCRLGCSLCSCVVMPCRRGKPDSWLCVRDWGQTAINKHHVSNPHGLQVSCFPFVPRRQPPHHHGECLNDLEGCRDVITEVQKGGFLFFVCVCCAMAQTHSRLWWNMLRDHFWQNNHKNICNLDGKWNDWRDLRGGMAPKDLGFVWQLLM